MEDKLLPDRKTIAEMQKKGFGQMYGDKLRDAYNLDWYFHGWEKLLITGCFIWTVWSIVSWLWRIL